MVVYTGKPSHWEVEAGDSGVQVTFSYVGGNMVGLRRRCSRGMGGVRLI